MTDDQRKKCHAIIHGASASSAAIGGGMAQLPGSDAAVLFPIQVGMVIALGRVFGLTLTEGSAKGTVMATGATYCGRYVTQVLVGWIPVFGNAINAITAGGLTEAMGWLIIEDFEKEMQIQAKTQNS